MENPGASEQLFACSFDILQDHASCLGMGRSYMSLPLNLMEQNINLGCHRRSRWSAQYHYLPNINQQQQQPGLPPTPSATDLVRILAVEIADVMSSLYTQILRDMNHSVSRLSAENASIKRNN